MTEEKTQKYFYKVKLKWKEAKTGVVSSGDRPDIQVSAPVEFDGQQGLWTAQNLLVASVVSCFMTTFVFQAKKHGLEFSSLDIAAQGLLEKVEDTFMISKIELIPHLVIYSLVDKDKAEKVLQRADQFCLISNSIKSKIFLIPDVEIKTKGA
ncbi:MAG: OsmC family protein [bacterium]